MNHSIVEILDAYSKAGSRIDTTDEPCDLERPLFGVDIMDVFIDRKSKKAKFEIIIQEPVQQAEIQFYKSYDDFKTLHSKLQKIIGEKALPQLPNKGDYGIFVKTSDERVLKYRQTALEKYLKKVLNDRVY